MNILSTDSYTLYCILCVAMLIQFYSRISLLRQSGALGRRLQTRRILEMRCVTQKHSPKEP